MEKQLKKYFLRKCSIGGMKRKSPSSDNVATVNNQNIQLSTHLFNKGATFYKVANETTLNDINVNTLEEIQYEEGINMFDNCHVIKLGINTEIYHGKRIDDIHDKSTQLYEYKNNKTQIMCPREDADAARHSVLFFSYRPEVDDTFYNIIHFYKLKQDVYLLNWTNIDMVRKIHTYFNTHERHNDYNKLIQILQLIGESVRRKSIADLDFDIIYQLGLLLNTGDIKGIISGYTNQPNENNEIFVPEIALSQFNPCINDALWDILEIEDTKESIIKQYMSARNKSTVKKPKQNRLEHISSSAGPLLFDNSSGED
jgi:hypothetical protein